MIKKLCLLVLLSSSSLFGSIKFDYEEELILMAKNPTHYECGERQYMYSVAALWINHIISGYSLGKIKLSTEDREYLERISYLAADMANMVTCEQTP